MVGVLDNIRTRRQARGFATPFLDRMTAPVIPVTGTMPTAPAAPAAPRFPFLQQNSNALLAAGAGLLGGGAGAWSQGAQGWLAGTQVDQQNRERQEAEAEQQRQTEALNTFLATNPLAAELDPSMIDYARTDPDFARQLLGHFATQSLAGGPEWQPYTDPTTGWTGRINAAGDVEWNPEGMQPPAPAGQEPPEVIDGIGPNGETIKLVFAPEHPNADEFGLVQIGGERLPSGMSITLPDGTVIRQGAGGAGATEGQASANIYATRMENSSPIIDEFAAAGMNFWEHIASGAGIIGNFIVSPERQQFDQAARDFINASLRRESGAVISEQEFANARQQYLPMPGDSPEVLRQKAENRRLQIEGIRAASGPFSTQGSGAPAPTPAVPSFDERFDPPAAATGPLAPGTYQYVPGVGVVPVQ